MRSNRPMPGNPWPHDMVLRIEDSAQALLELLWLREAHALQPVGEDLPPGLVDAPAPVAAAVSASTRSAWESAWPQLWREVVAHAGRETDPRVFERLHETAGGSVERAEMLRSLIGPSWGERFGDEALAGGAFAQWERRRAEERERARPRSLAETPERRDLEALIPAWRAGLTTVVTVPCTGEFARRVGANVLLTTDAARRSSDSYRRALSVFVDGSGAASG